MSSSNDQNIVRILIAGEGGQGVQTIAKILANVAHSLRYKVIFMPASDLPVISVESFFVAFGISDMNGGGGAIVSLLT